MIRRLLRWLGGAGLLLAMLAVFRGRLCRLLGCNQELITISSPGAGSLVTSPVSVAGWGRATQHNQLVIEVRDSSNALLGSGTAAISGALGQPGPFSGSVTFGAATPGTPGHIQVYDSSPATGATTHLTSIMVTFA